MIFLFFHSTQPFFRLSGYKTVDWVSASCGYLKVHSLLTTMIGAHGFQVYHPSSADCYQLLSQSSLIITVLSSIYKKMQSEKGHITCKWKTHPRIEFSLNGPSKFSMPFLLVDLWEYKMNSMSLHTD